MGYFILPCEETRAPLATQSHLDSRLDRRVEIRPVLPSYENRTWSQVSYFLREREYLLQWLELNRG